MSDAKCNDISVDIDIRVIISTIIHIFMSCFNVLLSRSLASMGSDALLSSFAISSHSRKFYKGARKVGIDNSGIFVCSSHEDQ